MPDIDFTKLQGWLTSGQGTLLAAAILSLVMLLLKNVPWISERLQTPWQKRALAAVLAFVPMLIMALEKAPSLQNGFFTAVFAFLGSTAIHHIWLDKPAPDPAPEPQPGPSVGPVAVTIDPTQLTKPQSSDDAGPAD